MPLVSPHEAGWLKLLSSSSTFVSFFFQVNERTRGKVPFVKISEILTTSWNTLCESYVALGGKFNYKIESKEKRKALLICVLINLRMFK